MAWPGARSATRAHPPDCPLRGEGARGVARRCHTVPSAAAARAQSARGDRRCVPQMPRPLRPVQLGGLRPDKISSWPVEDCHHALLVLLSTGLSEGSPG